jgi:hypothetical protein
MGRLVRTRKLLHHYVIIMMLHRSRVTAVASKVRLAIRVRASVT